MAQGTLTVASLVVGSTTYPGLVIKLDILNFPDGFPHVDPSWEVEPIKGMGVPYNRLRLNRPEFIPDALRCMAGYASYANAVTAARAWRQLVGHTATLKYTAGGVLYDLTQIMFITGVIAAPRTSPLVGAATNVVDPQAIVTAQFSVEYTAA